METSLSDCNSVLGQGKRCDDNDGREEDNEEEEDSEDGRLKLDATIKLRMAWRQQLLTAMAVGATDRQWQDDDGD